MRHPRVVPARPRPKDPVYTAPPAGAAGPPASIDLRSRVAAKDWPIWDQGDVPSCTAHAVAGVALFETIAAGRTPRVVPSRLFLYYNERVMDGDAGEEACSFVSDGIDVVLEHGFCADTADPGVVPPEAVWPYSTDLTTVTTRPPAGCYAFAKSQRGFTHARVPADLHPMKGSLADGHPFTILISMCSWNRVGPRGDIPLPTPDERATADRGGWHAMAVVGYDDASRRFIVRNSMGVRGGGATGWGDGGYGTIPYDFLTDATISDPYSMFTLRVVKS